MLINLNLYGLIKKKKGVKMRVSNTDVYGNEIFNKILKFEEDLVVPLFMEGNL